MPVPDPSERTVEQSAAALIAERSITDGQFAVIRARLDGMDLAVDLRLAAVDAIPGQIDEKIKCLEDVIVEKFASIERQFELIERNRVEQKTDTATALAQALAAAEKAVEKQTEASEKSTTKSEGATTKAIDELSKTFTTAIEGLRRELGDNKTRIERIEALGVGNIAGREQTESARTTAEQRAQRAQMLVLSILGAVFSAAFIGLAIFAATGR